jgi:aryl-alcohol dehydrogenase-like predicted oxidoreductase
MEYRILGKSDLKISRLGFGSMSLDADNPQNERLLHQALERGINYFDTADLYQQGGNESILGRAFKGKRDRIVLATKVGNQWRSDGSGWDWNPSRKYIVEAVEESLKRLQTDYIDLYQLHGGTLEDPVDEIIETMEALQKSGKIRYYGISSIRPNVIRAYTQRSSIISVMMQFSLLDRRPEEEMLSYLHEHRIGVLARGSIAKGLLISKPPERYLNYSAEQVMQLKDVLKSVSDPSGTPLAAALQYVWQAEGVCSAVLGIRTEEQLKAALVAGSSSPLTKAQWKQLREVLSANKYVDHR